MLLVHYDALEASAVHPRELIKYFVLHLNKNVLFLQKKNNGLQRITRHNYCHSEYKNESVCS